MDRHLRRADQFPRTLYALPDQPGMDGHPVGAAEIFLQKRGRNQEFPAKQLDRDLLRQMFLHIICLLYTSPAPCPVAAGTGNRAHRPGAGSPCLPGLRQLRRVWEVPA